jgi:hypothetical protein
VEEAISLELPIGVFSGTRAELKVSPASGAKRIESAHRVEAFRVATKFLIAALWVELRLPPKRVILDR